MQEYILLLHPASVGFFVDGAKFSSIPANATIIGVNVSMKTQRVIRAHLLYVTLHAGFIPQKKK